MSFILTCMRYGNIEASEPFMYFRMGAANLAKPPWIWMMVIIIAHLVWDLDISDKH